MPLAGLSLWGGATLANEMHIKNYQVAEAFLSEVPKFTRKNPLEQSKAFYQYIQQNHSAAFAEKNLGRIVHVAGTNGKGSVCAFIQQICLESGLHVGMFTSPHLITTRERFCIDGEMISEEIFLKAFFWLADRLGEYRAEQPQYQPSYFERLFFMGVYIFASAGVDITILETGLGGRLDTTNVIQSPAVCVITEIGRDHMEYLGDTIEEIAGEKAGIIKPNIPVVFVDRKNKASVVLEKRVADCGCFCEKVSENDYKICEIQKKSIDFSVHSRYYDYGRLTFAGTALYQAENAAIAVRTCEVLANQCNVTPINADTIQKGILHMRWRGRMEEVLPNVFIDGAHNEDGIAAFADSLNYSCNLESGAKCILVFSAVNDKDYQSMAARLCAIPKITDFVLTYIPSERGTDPKALKQQFITYTDKPVFVMPQIIEAVAFALREKGSQGVVYIVGSLYLAGIVEELLNNGMLNE